MTDYSTKIKTLSKQPKNNKCIDCNEPNPQWTSISHGIFICINCAATHRSYGVNISRVRSVLIDKWNKIEYDLMELGGNDRFIAYCNSKNLNQIDKEMMYKHPAVAEYRKQFIKVEEVPRYTQPRPLMQINTSTQGWKTYVAEKAVAFKNKSIEIGSKINRQYIVPGFNMIKEKATGTVNKKEEGRKTEDVVNEVETKKDYSKWD